MSKAEEIFPKLMYGTAWKEDLTEACVFNAISAGFRAIDTANQRKHYYEEGVGYALKKAYRELGLQRQDLFLQTKFTYSHGQDHRKAYDDTAPFDQQVKQSFEGSIKHLSTDYLDSYILHGPHNSDGLDEVDWIVWRSMEELYKKGKVKHLGIANISYDQIKNLFQKSAIKPKFVQNRCFANLKWDKQIRNFCNENGIYYQGFSLLTANRQYLGGEVLRPEGRNIPHLVFNSNHEELDINLKLKNILEQTGKNISQVIFRFAQQVGIIPLIGTRSTEHMNLDLNINDFSLNQNQISDIESIAEQYTEGGL